MLKSQIAISVDQYISDIAHELPTGPRFPLIIAGTGCGKIHHMLDHAHKTGGTCCTPTKAINEQKRIQFVKRHGVEPHITQIEHFKDLNVRKLECIHLDECQILYNAGYRGPAIDAALDKFEQAAKVMPVCLWTATAGPSLMPVQLATVTQVIKPFKRNLNVIQIDTKGMRLNSPEKLARCIEFIC